MITFGIIGAGRLGTNHATNIAQMDGAKLTAVYDIDPAKAKVFNEQYGAVICNSADELANMVDAVLVASPSDCHLEGVTAAVKANKPVFSEKPLCRTLEEISVIRDAVRNAGKFFNVGMCVRAWPEYASAKEIVDSGKLGAVKSALFRRLSPSVDGNAWNNWFMCDEMAGGAALDLHTHDTDVICHMFGYPAAVRSAGARGVVSDKGIDQIITSYDYNDGKFITAEAGWCAPSSVPFEMSFQIICEKGTLKLDAAGFHLYWNCGKVETPDTGDASLPTGWHRELKYFTDCVRDNVEPNRYQTPESVCKSLSVVMAEIDSVDCKMPVEVKYV